MNRGADRAKTVRPQPATKAGLLAAIFLASIAVIGAARAQEVKIVKSVV